MTYFIHSRSGIAGFFQEKFSFVVLAVLLLFMGGCATTIDKESITKTTTEKRVEKSIIERTKPARPKIELTKDILYKILVAEFAGQRGRLDLSLKNYLELAEQTRDPKLIERATRIAVYARDTVAAEKAARLWLELDQHNPDAHQVLAVMALRQGDIDGTIEHLQIIFDDSYGDVNQKLWMVVNLLGREKDVELVMAVVERLLEQFRDNSDAVYALANIAARLGKLDRAQELLEMTLDMVPDNDNAAMSYISILQRQGQVDTAVKWLEEVLPQRKSNDFVLRLAYARLLTDVRRLDDARRQFEILSVSAPNNVDVLYALGLLYLQSNRLDEAESYFKRLSNQNKRPNEAYYYLGRIREEQKDYKKASIWYQGVQKGDNYFDAQIRLGLIKAKLGSTDDARKHLRGIQARGEEDKTVLTQAEAELLIDEKRYEEAMEVYDKALAGQYNSELFYSRAMLAEKMGRIDILEKDLRTILAAEPDHSQALNALGYTLADRTDRHEEAYLLIKRALELSPDDFYILDSMGWVLYRLGRHQEAIEYLRKAMLVRRDPEIAAHFGEVLWVSGDKKAAKEIWETALEETPDDEEEELLNVIKRFRP